MRTTAFVSQIALFLILLLINLSPHPLIPDDYDFTKMAYNILYIMCLPTHGEITETIKLIFSISTVLHNYGTPSSKISIQKNGPHSENIIEFFLYLLDTYPTNTAPVLDNFIKAVVTNPDETVGSIN